MRLMPLRLLVCGTRTYSDEEYMFSILDDINHAKTVEVVIEGEAKGADKMARRWAEQYSIPVAKFPADWKRYKSAAGPIRNKQMIVESKPDFVAAFIDKPLAETKGTKNMLELADAAEIEYGWYSREEKFLWVK